MLKPVPDYGLRTCHAGGSGIRHVNWLTWCCGTSTLPKFALPGFALSVEFLRDHRFRQERAYAESRENLSVKTDPSGRALRLRLASN